MESKEELDVIPNIENFSHLTILSHVQAEVRRQGGPREISHCLMEEPHSRHKKSSATIVERILIKKVSPLSKELYSLMPNYLDDRVETIKRHIVMHLELTLGKSRFHFSSSDCRKATYLSLRDRISEKMNDSFLQQQQDFSKTFYLMYPKLSIPHTLRYILLSLGLEDQYSNALKELGLDISSFYKDEIGVARYKHVNSLMDSLISLQYCVIAYGLWTDIGVFSTSGSPWIVDCHSDPIKIDIGGSIISEKEEFGYWNPEYYLQALPFDVPVPGYNTMKAGVLRLWKAVPSPTTSMSLHLKQLELCGALTALFCPKVDSEQQRRLLQLYFYYSPIEK